MQTKTMMKVLGSTVAAALLLLGGSARAQLSGRPACDDGNDNDGDGLIDYSPVPGQGDPGCDAWNDTDEQGSTTFLKIKPRLAVLFDTSGSMAWHVESDTYTGGDGSVDCPGDQTARMRKVKDGTFDAIAAYGELEYSLYRFHMERQGSFSCPGGPDYGAGQFIGRWRGSPTTSGECVDTGPNPDIDYNRADRLVKFAPENQKWILQWMDETTNYTSRDYELRPSGFTPIAGSLATIRSDLQTLRNGDTARDCRPYRVVVVTDGQETCDDAGTDGAAAAAANLLANGFPVYVIGFASQAFQADMDQIANEGGTGDAFLADSPAELSNALAQIVDELVLVEKCNDMDDDCDGVIDNGFNKGPCDDGKLGKCRGTGQIVCVSDSETACVIDHPGEMPTPEEGQGCNGIDDDCDGIIDDGLQCAGCGTEICNGRDDDCDGSTDESPVPGEGEECGVTEGACEPGHLRCQNGKLVCVGAIGPAPEVCNGKDDNCDGVIDHIIRPCYTFGGSGCIDKDPRPGVFSFECKGQCRAGTQSCNNGDFGNCIGQVGPSDEICNGLDDDCDGMVDEGFENVGQPCSVGTGLCTTTGHFVCSNGGVVCDAPIITGTPEVCNGVDDDCNGTIDDLPNPPPPPIGEPCGTCGGVYQCRNGLVCAGGSANAEVCNGLDDDCNNIVDDGILPGVGDSCVPTNSSGVPLFEIKGQCKPGHKECIAGGLTCVGYIGPTAEVCDGADNDCDGNVDDMAACPSPTDACFNMACVSPCMSGEFPCPFGQFCKTLPEGRFCVPNPCLGKTCPTGQVCDPETTECKDPCEGITCPSGTSCRNGRCLDCFTLGCPSGQLCIEDDNRIGHCQVDACMNVTCAERQTCVGGNCVAVGCPAGCDGNQRCDNGVCVARCETDVCFGTVCAEGFVCNPANGRCIADPCERTNCGGTFCSLTCEGQATCSVSQGIDVLATGSGGAKLSCEIGQASGSRAPWIAGLLYLGLVVSLRIRRKK